MNLFLFRGLSTGRTGSLDINDARVRVFHTRASDPSDPALVSRLTEFQREEWSRVTSDNPQEWRDPTFLRTNAGRWFLRECLVYHDQWHHVVEIPPMVAIERLTREGCIERLKAPGCTRFRYPSPSRLNVDPPPVRHHENLPDEFWRDVLRWDSQHSDTLAEARKRVEEADIRAKSLAIPKKIKKTLPVNDERDAWIYEACVKDACAMSVLEELNSLAPTRGWNRLSGKSSILKAAGRWAKRHGHPPPYSSSSTPNKS